jgi:hypothetical protein
VRRPDKVVETEDSQYTVCFAINNAKLTQMSHCVHDSVDSALASQQRDWYFVKELMIDVISSVVIYGSRLISTVTCRLELVLTNISLYRLILTISQPPVSVNSLCLQLPSLILIILPYYRTGIALIYQK